MAVYQVMSFTDMVNMVITETGRDEMTFSEDGGTGEIPRALQAATLKMHGLDFFYKDIQTAQVVFDSSAYIQTLDVTTLPRYRNISYIRKWDPTLQTYQLNPTLLPPLFNSVGAINTQQSLGMLQVIDIDDIFDDYGTEKMDICYQAGSTLFIKCSNAISYALAGWYAYPVVDISNHAANYNSWIANEYPFALIYDASSKIYAGTGQQDQSRKFDSPDGQGGLVQGEISRILMNNVHLGGR